MEIRARYTLIGLFTLAVAAAAFTFVYWLNNAYGLTQRSVYQARFETSVSGLLRGSAVLFNGIRVGEVTELHLSNGNPKQVTAIIAVEPQTPVRSDTTVGIDFQGLTGSPVISLTGGTAAALPAVSTDGQPPLLLTDPGAGQNMTETARGVLRHIDKVIADNSEPLKTLIANINTFSGALARNSDRVDGIVAGLERMTGGGAGKARGRVFDLIAPRDFPLLTKLPEGQLLIAEPGILGSLYNDEIVVRTADGEKVSSFQGKWLDSLSQVLQSRIIQSFENANVLKILGRQPEGFKVDYQLLIDVRSFQVLASPTAVADIEFTAKIIGDNGVILGARIFHTSAPTNLSDEATVVASFNTAFQKAATELVVWSCQTI